MTYHYSELGPERFQHFCQALLVANFPNVQCLPVAQPDGGRDAFASHYLFGGTEREQEIIIFQVKFSRAPGEDRDQRAFLEDIVRSELPKIKQLKRHGVARYYLLTNISGTAHPEFGSIDKMNTFLSDELGIDAQCWWRDDLDRHLDNLPAVKWSFPEILKATDLLPALMNGLLGEAQERRQAAIKGYLASQYEDDEELKFKQVELQSRITDLFVDLPMAPVRTGESSMDLRLRYRHRVVMQRQFELREEYIVYPSSHHDSAAHFFLHGGLIHSPTRLVLEGAPGQGKSTVTQYICQVMRMRILGRELDLARVPEPFRRALVRLPFRVDLRDFAAWNSGIDPFQAKPVPLRKEEPRSLEGFLAAQVRFQSGGQDFTVSDLNAVARASHVLLALDGFDEVADIDKRRSLVQEITKATTRLENAGGYSVKVIVTSRPAAFAKSVSFPRDSWSYFELLPLQRPQVDEYASKWMQAKGFKEQEKTGFRRMLDSKLKETHTQFLSRNPMQLTILLALIYTRGPSLPEKRTAMYDTYMDLFFSRESEKNEIVKEHRDLLMDIHRYLAWKLQTGAEGGGSGSIESEVLRRTLLEYLDSQGESTAIVDQLFDGVIERVGALVSRVQDTYEFEVQPLREFFAARYLYETAPYSPAGNEKVGTKIERFDALARNPYWLNVARFYAGCFSKGEISALVDALREIANSQPYELTSHARLLALMLLGDWVFTQYQPAVRRVIELIGQRPQMRQLLAKTERDAAAAWTALPERCGRADFVEILLGRLAGDIMPDDRQAIGRVLIQNLSPAERMECWKSMRSEMAATRWIRAGEALRIFRVAPTTSLLGAIDTDRSIAVPALLRARRFDVLVEDNEMTDIARDTLLSSMRLPFFRPEPDAPRCELAVLADIVSYMPYQMPFLEDTGAPLHVVVEHRLNRSYIDDEGTTFDKKWSSVEEISLCEGGAAYRDFCNLMSHHLANSLEPWTELVLALQKRWGDRAAFRRIAIIAAGVRSKGELGRAPNGLFDATVPVTERFRFARLKSGAPRWWETQLSLVSPHDRFTLLLLLWTWATPRTLLQLSQALEAKLEELDPEAWRELYHEFACTSAAFHRRDGQASLSERELLDAIEHSPRLKVLLGRKVDLASRNLLVREGFADYAGDDPLVLRFVAETLMDTTHSPAEWEGALKLVRHTYERGALVSGRRATSEGTMSVEQATMVSCEPDKYPLGIVAEADNQLSGFAGGAIPTLLDISVKERWFAELG